MLSIFIIYSTDRGRQLNFTISCLRDMELYRTCQRTLIVDGKIDRVPEDWEVIQVPRIKGEFSWAQMWNAGVYSASFDIVLYLDSDRLLPNGYLQKVVDNAEDDLFLFTSKHFMVLGDLPLNSCKQFLRDNYAKGIFIEDDFLGVIRYEPRFGEPLHGPGKNVMSGNTAFTKRTYTRLGGIDPWYRGHGAFADTDFLLHSFRNGCRSLDLNLPELHYHHSKQSEEGDIDEQALRKMGLDNFIYYCNKWGLPMVLARNLALECGVKKPTRYIDKRLDNLRKE